MVKPIKDFDKHTLSDLRADADELGLFLPEDATRRQLADAINRELIARENPVDTQVQSTVPAHQPGKRFPVTLWLPGPAPLYPNPRIAVPGRRVPLRFNHGNLTVETQEEYDIVLRALGDQVFEEDIPAGRTVRPCQQCGYAPRATEARELHDLCHPVIGQL